MRAFRRFYARLEACPAPVVAVCVGNCVGAGAEIVAGCDIRVAGDNLALAWAGARLGVPVGPARLTPLVGLARAKELAFTGRVVGAEEAVALGLATRAVPAAEAEAAALELAMAVAANPIGGVRRMKALFRELERSTERVGRENALLEAFQRDGPGLPHIAVPEAGPVSLPSGRSSGRDDGATRKCRAARQRVGLSASGNPSERDTWTATTGSWRARRPRPPRRPGTSAESRSDDGVDERDRPVIEAGGGYAEGYDVAETDLVRNATHDDGEGDPLADRFTAERESDRSTADYGEPDDLHGPDDLAGSADR